VCCSVLQCVAVCCSMLQCVAVCCSVLQCVAVCFAVCCSVLQCVAVPWKYHIGCNSPALQCVAVFCGMLHGVVVLLQCVEACCSVLQCVAVCCSVLQCVAVCCRVLQRAAACCNVPRISTSSRNQSAPRVTSITYVDHCVFSSHPYFKKKTHKRINLCHVFRPMWHDSRPIWHDSWLIHMRMTCRNTSSCVSKHKFMYFVSVCISCFETWLLTHSYVSDMSKYKLSCHTHMNVTWLMTHVTWLMTHSNVTWLMTHSNVTWLMTHSYVYDLSKYKLCVLQCVAVCCSVSHVWDQLMIWHSFICVWLVEIQVVLSYS